MDSLEAALGRPLALQRVYHGWSDVFPDALDGAARGRPQGLRRAPVPGVPPRAGNAAGSGTAQDFVAAWRHVRDRLESDGGTNVSYVLTLMAWTYARGAAESWHPGDGYVDLLAADGYTWHGCAFHPGPWRSFRQVFRGFYAYGISKAGPMLVAEWGSVEDPERPGAKASRISSAAATLETWLQIRGVTWFDSGPPAARCPWWLDSPTSSFDAFVAMAADPYFGALG